MPAGSDLVPVASSALPAPVSASDNEALGNRIAEAAARIQAATYELLVLIREFDERAGWGGFASCAHWLSWRIGLAPGAAREHVRVARALADLPRLSGAMRRGAVSYSKVRAVTRVATPDNEQALLDVALAGTAAHVEQIVRTWRRVDRAAEAAEDRHRHESRMLHTWVDDDGMVVVRGRLMPEVGAALRRALEAALDAAPSPVDPDGAARDAADGLAPTVAQRRADALGTIAEAALAGGLDKGTAGDRYQVVVHVDADALADAGDRAEAAETRARPGDRNGTAGAATTDGRDTRASYVPAGTYERRPAAGDGATANADHASAASPAPPRSGAARPAARTHTACPAAARGQSALDEAGGIRVSAETARRLACDAAKVTMRHGHAGEVLSVGRRTRTISPALRRALAARDRHCRFPGCPATRCEAHHILHWAHGGETALDNLVLLCRRHHRAVHEEGFRVVLGAAGEVRFVRPDGRPLPEAPPLPAVTDAPLAPVTARLAQAGVRIGPHTATPAWRGERLDVDWAISVLWRPTSRQRPAQGV